MFSGVRFNESATAKQNLDFEEQAMSKRSYLFALAFGLAYLGVAGAQQHPILDMVANKVIQKYQAASCEQLWQERAQKGKQPPSAKEQEAVQILRNDPQMRTEFINRVAGPVANKMFECGMIP
jgi:hypothetical protein